MNRKVTSRDVAKEAGVSRATVSYVLNNVEDSRISGVTRDRVLKAIEKLGYHPDSIAQTMKTNKSMSIGVVSRRNITEARFTEILGGIKDVLSKERYSVVLCSNETDNSGYPEFYRLYHSKKIDGIIFISYQEQIEIEHIDNCADSVLKEKIPAVFIDYHLNDPLVNSVDINYNHGAYIAARYLIEKGHKKIGCLIPDFQTEQEKQRIRGINKAVEDADDVSLIMYNAGSNRENFSESIINTLNDRARYSALIVAWGSLACETLYFANKMSVKVPEDIAVIALAGNTSAIYTYPRLSTCDLPLYEAGKKGAQILMEQINKSELPVNITLPCALNIRDSI